MGNELKLQPLFNALLDSSSNHPFLWEDVRKIYLNALQIDVPCIAVLPMLACQGVGGGDEQALAVSMAWIALRYAAILLDAVQDDHLVPRPMPNVSPPLALNYATSLIFEAMKIIAEAYPPKHAQALIKLLSQTGIGASQGQALSAGKIEDLEIYWETTILKAGSIFQAGLSAGAIAGEGSSEQIAALGQYGLALGVVRQIYDDCHDGENGHLIPLLAKAGNDNPAQTIAAVLLNWREHALSCLEGLDGVASLRYILDEFVTKARLRD